MMIQLETVFEEIEENQTRFNQFKTFIAHLTRFRQ